MRPVITSRHNERCATVVTTNCEDVSDVEDLDSRLVAWATILHSRLRDMCEVLEYAGADYRDSV